jgi:sodium/potassium-transporting ATPase subunit alpha
MQTSNVVGRRSRRFSGTNAGQFRNKLILLGLAVEIAFSRGILYLPPLQEFRGTGPVNGHIYALAWL